MSTNFKDEIHPAFLMNFTKQIENRFIVLETSKSYDESFKEVLKHINDEINCLIQQLNCLIVNRQLPYIKLVVKFADLNESSRFVVRNYESGYRYEDQIRIKSNKVGTDISHVIDLLEAPGYKDILNSPLGCTAEVVVAHEFLECAIIDVLLDIIMFNSYSFLHDMLLDEKCTFNIIKHHYFLEKGLPCFYDYKTNSNVYYSFAFSARTGINCIDLPKFVDLWDQFIQEKYCSFHHREKTVSQQLKYHVDFEQLPRNLSGRFRELDPGAYLVIRTNRGRTEDLWPFISSVFALKKRRNGKIRIIPISEFEKYRCLFQNLDVSAFKVVKTIQK